MLVITKVIKSKPYVDQGLGQLSYCNVGGEGGGGALLSKYALCDLTTMKLAGIVYRTRTFQNSKNN